MICQLSTSFCYHSQNHYHHNDDHSIVILLLPIMMIITIIILFITIIMMIRSSWSRTLHRVLVKLLFYNTRGEVLWIEFKNRCDADDADFAQIILL